MPFFSYFSGISFTQSYNITHFACGVLGTTTTFLGAPRRQKSWIWLEYGGLEAHKQQQQHQQQLRCTANLAVCCNYSSQLTSMCVCWASTAGWAGCRFVLDHDVVDDGWPSGSLPVCLVAVDVLVSSSSSFAFFFFFFFFFYYYLAARCVLLDVPSFFVVAVVVVVMAMVVGFVSVFRLK